MVLKTPIWPIKCWWPSFLQLIAGPCHILPETQEILSLPHKPCVTHSLQKMKLGVFLFIRKSLKNQGIPRKARNIILKSWRASRNKQYNTYIEKWFHYCGQSQYPLSLSVNFDSFISVISPG